MKLELFLPRTGKGSVEYLNQHVAIEHIMRRPAITIGPDQSLESAARLMAEHGIHALPVTVRDERLIGILSTTDIMDAVLHPRRPTAEQAIGEPAAAGELTREQFDDTLRSAMRAAHTSGERGRLAQALLQLHGQIKPLDHVLECAKRYVHAGQDTRLHAALVAAIQQAARRAGPEDLSI
jgi:CBS-domain-containing membrane protein